MSYIEIIKYNYGSGIFNFIDKPNKKYRQNVNHMNITSINKEDIYKNNHSQLINIFFLLLLP